MRIQKVLREYNFKKTEIQACKERIEYYKRLLEKPGSYVVQSIAKKSKSVVISSGGKYTNSPVEIEITHNEDNIKRNKRVINQWINDEELKLVLLEIQVKQIKSALDTLDKYELFIIESQFTEKRMDINDLEYAFNKNFRNRELSQDGLRNVKNEAMKKIKKILIPFYEKLGGT